MTVAQQISNMMDRYFLRSLDAHSIMSMEEIIQSDRRAVKYRREWEEFKNQQRKKYGLHDGPSPAVVIRDVFIPTP